MAQVNISIPKRRNRETEKKWATVRPKPGSADINSCSSLSGTWGTQGQNRSFKVLGQPRPYGQLQPDILSLGLAPFTACSFPQQTFRIPGLSNFLGLHCNFGFIPKLHTLPF